MEAIPDNMVFDYFNFSAWQSFSLGIFAMLVY